MTSIKKAAIALAAGGTALGLISMGVGASFTDGASATQTISVGSFGCAISSTTPGAVTVGKTVTLTSGPLTSSAAGTAPLVFKVASTGTIPIKVSVTQTNPLPPFTSLLAAPVADQTLGSMANTTYSAGLQWPELVLGDAGKTTSITYAVSCTEVSAPKFATLTGTAGIYGPDNNHTWIPGADPVVNMAASTITWTIPVTTANTPVSQPSYGASNFASQMGRFTAVPVAGNVSILASMSLSSGLTADPANAAKFHVVYRSTSVGVSYGNVTIPASPWSEYVPFTGINLAATSWANNPGYGHDPTDNGLGVSWTGVTSTGTATIVLAFSTN